MEQTLLAVHQVINDRHSTTSRQPMLTENGTEGFGYFLLPGFGHSWLILFRSEEVVDFRFHHLGHPACQEIDLA
jgi:hypothetical protein